MHITCETHANVLHKHLGDSPTTHLSLFPPNPLPPQVLLIPPQKCPPTPAIKVLQVFISLPEKQPDFLGPTGSNPIC